jgi:hypothetical protein
MNCARSGAGSRGCDDLIDVAPVLAQAAREAGVTFALTTTNSLTGTQTVVGGHAAGHRDAQ